MNPQSSAYHALKIIDAAQRKMEYQNEGYWVLESIRRHMYRTAPADLWR